MPKADANKEEAMLIRRGFHGLWTPEADGCGCHVGNLYPCGQRLKSCRPGYRQVNAPVYIGPRYTRIDNRNDHE